MFRFFLFILFVMSLSLTQAAVHTATHTYIVSRSERKILVINRKTGEEEIIDMVSEPVSMTIHGDFGYIEYHQLYFIEVINLKNHKVIGRIKKELSQRSMAIYNGLGYLVSFVRDDIAVIDLISQTFKEKIAVGACPEQMLIHGDRGYVLYWSSKNIAIIDLTTNRVLQTIPLEDSYRSMVIYSDSGYVVHSKIPKISVIDLKTMVVTQIPLPGEGKSLVIDKDLGYALGDKISVIDLKTNKHVKSIDVGGPPESIIINGDYGYVLVRESPTLAILDLKTHTLSKSIMLDKYPHSFSIHGDFAYVRNEYAKSIFVVDLKIGEVINTIPNPEGLSSDVSETNLYLGVHQINVGMCLFKVPYSGIEGFYLDQDPDEAFKNFEEAVLKKECRAAKEYFEIALSFGHRKACAVAFYAFHNGLWGARKDEFWENEFMRVMDLEYFSQLDHEKEYHNNLKRTTLEGVPSSMIHSHG